MAYGGVDLVMNDLPVRLSVPAGGKRAVSGTEQPWNTAATRGADESVWGCSQPLSHWHLGWDGASACSLERGMGRPRTVILPDKTT